MRSITVRLLFVAGGICLAPGVTTWAAPFSTAFTYQGQLKKGGVPIAGTATIVFRLFDAEVGGTRIGPEIGYDSVDLVDGLLRLTLDFGESAFPGDPRWLEVAVDFPSDGTNWATLSPRQPITPTPYALTARRAENLQLPFEGSTDSGQDAVSVTNSASMGSTAYLRNSDSSNADAALLVEQGGTGRGGHFAITNVTSNSDAVWGFTAGTGAGVSGYTWGAATAVDGQADGTGSAASFQTTLSSNTSPTLYVEQQGRGRGGHFRITNSGNDMAAVSASTTGDGPALSGYTVGAGPAVHAKTDGTGYAIHADSTDDVEPEGGGVVLIGREDGNNVAIDGNEIMARSNGETSALFINNDGGDVVFGGAIDIGYEAVYDNAWDTDTAAVYCPAGKKVLGGGCYSNTEGNYIEESRPIAGGTGWQCRSRYSIVWIGAYAVCANVK